MYPPGHMQEGGILYSRVARIRSSLEDPCAGLIYVRLGLNICPMVWKPQLSRLSSSNRRLLHENRRLDPSTIGIVEWLKEMEIVNDYSF